MRPNEFLLDTAVKATAILLAAVLLAWMMRRASAAARYFLWTSALGAILAAPLLSLILPAWAMRVTIPARMPAARGVVIVSMAPSDAQAGPAVPETPAEKGFPWTIAIWFAGALVALARLGAGHIRWARSLRRAAPVDSADWMAARDEAGRRIGARRAISLRRSRETDVPMTGGVIAARVVLPESAEEWDGQRRSIVLLHELTHARRRDPLLWLMAQVAVAVYWFHPLAWLALARFRREQEQSCDDAVVRAGTERSTYAEHLVALARSAGGYAASLSMAAPSDLEHRVQALLDRGRRRGDLSRKACWMSAAALLAAIVPLAALHAQASPVAASLSGTVYDVSGAVVPNVLVLLKSHNDRQDAARSNAAGEYTFSSVPAGSYTLQARAPGFAEFHQAIVLPAARTNIVLSLGSVSEAVDVIGKAPRPRETAAPQRIRVGGNVQATKLLKMVQPAYPPGAEAAGIQGTVLLRAVISTSGELLGLLVINQSVDAELANAAMEAVKQWRYQPTLLNGAPVEVATTITVTFRLDR